MATLPTKTMMLNFGPQHPATHGTLRIVMELDGEIIVKATPHIGYLHSGFEKIGEVMSFNQYVTVTDRMNYMSPLANNIGFSMTCEKLLGIEATRRCQFIRVILAELSRIADHLVCLGTQAIDLGAFTVFLYGFREREKLYDIFELCCGARYTNTYTRVGGLMRDVPPSFVDAVKKFCMEFPETLKDLETLLTHNKIWMNRTKDIGVITPEDAMSYGITGPCLRGSGIAWDLRRAEPYMIYPELDFDIPLGTVGDVYDRYLVRVEEMKQSVRIVLQALEKMPAGPVNVEPAKKATLPEKPEVYYTMEGLIHHFELVMPRKSLFPPQEEVYCATESPNGELGFYLVSNGTEVPYRIRVRPPSFVNYSIFPKLVEGRMIADAVSVLGSLNIIAAELDR